MLVRLRSTPPPRKLLIFLRIRERSMRAYLGQRYPSYVIAMCCGIWLEQRFSAALKALFAEAASAALRF